MSPIWKPFTTAVALAAILIVWGCEQGTEPLEPLQAERTAASSLLEGGDSVGDATIQEVEALGDIAGLRSVQRHAGATASNLVSAVFGVEGGQLELEGHLLTVPPGAVLAATRFTMRLVPNGGVEVDLRATQAIEGDIGSRGFEIPVQLALSYVGTDGEDNPEDLVIVRVGTGERLETVVDGSRVRAELDHFSRYRLCSN